MPDFTKIGILLAGRRREVRQLPGPGDVALGADIGGQPVMRSPPAEGAADHGLNVGGSGSGKTFLTAHWQVAAIAQEFDVPPSERAARLVVDPKWDLAECLLAGLAARCPERLADVRILDPFGRHGFPFNVAKLRLPGVPREILALLLAVLVATASTALGALQHLGVGARQVDTLYHFLLGAISVPDDRRSALLALDALASEGTQKLLASITASPHAKRFLQTAYLSEELRASCASRLRLAFAATAAQERIFSSAGCLDLSELTAPGRITIVDLSGPPGGLSALQTLWASLVVRVVAEHLLARTSPWKGHRAHIIVDEAQVIAGVLSDIFERAATQGRSRGISMTLMTQGTALLSEESKTLLPVLLSNVQYSYVGRMNASDAELFAAEQAPVYGSEERIRDVRERLAAEICNLQPREFLELRPGSSRRFRTADVPLSEWRAAAERHQDAIEAARSCYALPPSTGPRPFLEDLAPAAEERPRRRGAGPAARGSGEGRRSKPRGRWG